MVSDFDIADEFAALDYDASAFMASDQGPFGLERPVSSQGV